MSTVWLTQIVPDPRRLPVDRRTGLIDGDALHRILMKLVPDGLGEHPRAHSGLLYRTEPTATGITVLAQTRTTPRTDALDEGFAHRTQRKDLTSLLNALRPGLRVRYRVAANPTKRHGPTSPDELRGKLTVLRGEAADLWWLRKATAAGLHPLQVSTTTHADVLGANRTRHGVTRFDGVGVVTDPDLLTTAITEGIGRAKNYGCGLLSLGPAERAS